MTTDRLTWRTSACDSAQTPLAPPSVDQVRTVRVDLHVEKRSGLRFHLDLLAADSEDFHRVPVVVEWEGDNAIFLPACALKPVGRPPGLEHTTAVRLSRDEPSRGDVVTVRDIAYSDRHLPRPVNPWEDALETFFLRGFWTPRDWRIASNRPLDQGDRGRGRGRPVSRPGVAERTTTPIVFEFPYLSQPSEDTVSRGRFELFRNWFWADLTIRTPEAGDWVSLHRTYAGGVDVSAYEALVALISFEKGAAFGIELELDGGWVESVRSRGGTGDFEEIVAPLGGARRLDGIRLRISATEGGKPTLGGVLSWILLQKKGADVLEIRRHGALPARVPPAHAKRGRAEARRRAPELYFGPGDIPALRAKSREGLGRAIWRKIRADADQHLHDDPEPFVGEFLPIRRGGGLTRRFVEEPPLWEKQIPALGLCYLMTGEEAYARQARRLILAACRCRHWGTAFIERFPAGVWGYRAPFYPARTAAAVATGTDWIAATLSDGERDFIADCLLDKAVFWIESYLERMSYCRHNNQGAVFAAGGILAALAAARRRPEARARAHKLGEYLHAVLADYLDEDGATGEGPGYWSYTMGEAATALVALARDLGVGVREWAPPALARSIDYPLYLRSHAARGGGWLNIGDARFGGHVASVTLLFFARYLARHEAFHLWRDRYGAPGRTPGDVFSFLFLEPRMPTRPPALPACKCFRGTQRVFWRSGWKPRDISFVFESGRWGPDHFHQDKHQILLEAFGERMLIDRGMCDYANPLARQLKATASHNTVTVDGRDQTSTPGGPACVLERHEQTDGCCYLSSEARRAYRGLLDRFRREVLFARPHYFVLADTIEGARGKLAWHFHSALKPAKRRTGFVLRGRRGSLIVYVAGMPDYEWSVETLESDVEGGAGYHLVLTPVSGAANARFTAVLYPLRSGREAAVRIRRQENRLLIRCGDVADTVTLPGPQGAALGVRRQAPHAPRRASRSWISARSKTWPAP